MSWEREIGRVNVEIDGESVIVTIWGDDPGSTSQMFLSEAEAKTLLDLLREGLYERFESGLWR